MENPEGVLNLLDEFAKLKSKEIPNDLEEYLLYVAASGDPVYQWSLIKSLYRQKLINVITEFYEMCPVMDIPPCPNVDPFNYETMKNSLLKRLDSFSSAPFTIQRISELLTTPRKQYNRVDKFMRAIEKNIWVVSTREPGPREPVTPQETSTNLVNGVSPRVCVTVKHPKRVKSIEERIKSGHPQLIDDDDEEEEEEEEEEEIDEYEQMEVESSTEILPNNDTDDTSLQCTSVKDLIEKYENGTIFSNAEEKTDFEEKSVQLEDTASASTSAPTSVPTTVPVTEPNSESVPSTSDLISENKQTEEATETLAAKESTPEPPSVSEKEQGTPAVAADSSSDLPVQESDVEESVEAEAEGEDEADGGESTLDSTSDIPIEESQPVAESSTSGSDTTMDEIDSASSMPEQSREASTSEVPSETVGTDEFQPASESSSDSVSESTTKETDPESKEILEKETV